MKNNYFKKSQITFFIIVGIIILLFILFLFYVYKMEIKIVPSSPSSKESIEVFIKDCIDNSIIESTFYLGKHAGLHELPNYHSTYSIYKIVYSYNYPTTILLPNHIQLERNYSKKINNTILECFDNFDYYKSKGYEVELAYLNTSSNIESNYSLVDVDIRVNYKRDKQIDSFTNYPTKKVSLKLGRLHEVADYIINYHKAYHETPIYDDFIEKLINEKISWEYHINKTNKIHYYFITQIEKGEYEKVYNYDENFKFVFAIEY
jgi:hypothetical protein